MRQRCVYPKVEKVPNNLDIPRAALSNSYRSNYEG
jgi:hypothetical protein